jgi:U3 small nucleolar RNA-associated protein 21
LFKDIELLNDLKEMSPSNIDVEMRSMSFDMGGTSELLEHFLQFILYSLTTRRDFELINSYLGLFLKINGDNVSQDDNLINIIEQIKQCHLLAWDNLKLSLNKSLCLVSYLKSVT